ncbi:MAG: hypothetical protein L6247_03725 [Desulfobacteraceae bacterium]|nr:hypothetical protein [Desulfobacteraceae bacterium]
MKQKWNLNIAGIIILMAASLILPTSLYAGTVKGVIGKGEAAVVGITAEQGQLIALQRARADAVGKAVGTNVLGSTLVKDSVLVAVFIKTFTSGFIVDEKVKWLPLGTFSENDKTALIPVYRVEITATVMIPEKKLTPASFWRHLLTNPSTFQVKRLLSTQRFQKNPSFRFANYFSAGRLYLVPEFFEAYSRIAEMAVEKILPYEVRKKGQQ